ncbi:MAG: hypothetical protein HZC02_00630 [Candidatus Levybacteria bacterium]|nr:hypothetical protein [Candidatus Levybacteria bacterium]
MKIRKSALFPALQKMLFWMASFHLVIIAIYALTTKEYVYLNLGNILDLKFIMPGVEYTPGLSLLLSVFPIGLFWYFYKKER